jgi:hypothetical protein
LSTGKSSRLFTNGCHAEIDDDRIMFLGENAAPKRLRMVLEPPAIRDCVNRGRFLLVRTRRLGFTPILREAIPEGMEEDLRSKIADLAAKD